jgi:hypothetical protein
MRVSERIERASKLRIARSDSGPLLVKPDVDRVFWLGFKAL